MQLREFETVFHARPRQSCKMPPQKPSESKAPHCMRPLRRLELNNLIRYNEKGHEVVVVLKTSVRKSSSDIFHNCFALQDNNLVMRVRR